MGDVGKSNCTYPIDFNPWTLRTRFRILIQLATKGRNLLVPLQVPLDFTFLAQRNAVQGEFHGGRFW